MVRPGLALSFLLTALLQTAFAAQCGKAEPTARVP